MSNQNAEKEKVAKIVYQVEELMPCKSTGKIGDILHKERVDTVVKVVAELCKDCTETIIHIIQQQVPYSMRGAVINRLCRSQSPEIVAICKRAVEGIITHEKPQDALKVIFVLPADIAGQILRKTEAMKLRPIVDACADSNQRTLLLSLIGNASGVH